jgi:hypothetical protein
MDPTGPGMLENSEGVAAAEAAEGAAGGLAEAAEAAEAAEVAAGGLAEAAEMDISGVNLAVALIDGTITKHELFDRCLEFSEMIKLSDITDFYIDDDGGDEGTYNIVRRGRCKFRGEPEEKAITKVVIRTPKLEDGGLNPLLCYGNGDLTAREIIKIKGELMNQQFWMTCSDEDIVPKVYYYTLYKRSPPNQDKIMACMISEAYDNNLQNYYHQRVESESNNHNDLLIAQQLYSLMDKLFQNDFWCVDLMPSNCVIRMIEDKPVVKLIDVDAGRGDDEMFCGKKVATHRAVSHGFSANLGLLLKLIITICFVIYLPINIFAHLPNEDLFLDESHATCRAIFLSHYTGYYNDSLIVGISKAMTTIIDHYTKPLGEAMRQLGQQLPDVAAGEIIWNASHTIHGTGAESTGADLKKMISPLFFSLIWEIARNGGISVIKGEFLAPHIVKVATMGLNYPYERQLPKYIIEREGLNLFDETLRALHNPAPPAAPAAPAPPAAPEPKGKKAKKNGGSGQNGGKYSESRKKRRSYKKKRRSYKKKRRSYKKKRRSYKKRFFPI